MQTSILNICKNHVYANIIQQIGWICSYHGWNASLIDQNQAKGNECLTSLLVKYRNSCLKFLLLTVTFQSLKHLSQGCLISTCVLSKQCSSIPSYPIFLQLSIPGQSQCGYWVYWLPVPPKSWWIIIETLPFKLHWLFRVNSCEFPSKIPPLLSFHGDLHWFTIHFAKDFRCGTSFRHSPQGDEQIRATTQGLGVATRDPSYVIWHHSLDKLISYDKLIKLMSKKQTKFYSTSIIC